MIATTKTVTTEDTGETIDGVTVLGDYHENGGYDWMELIGEHGWKSRGLGGNSGLCAVEVHPDQYLKLVCHEISPL